MSVQVFWSCLSELLSCYCTEWMSCVFGHSPLHGWSLQILSHPQTVPHSADCLLWVLLWQTAFICLFSFLLPTLWESHSNITVQTCQDAFLICPNVHLYPRLLRCNQNCLTKLCSQVSEQVYNAPPISQTPPQTNSTGFPNHISRYSYSNNLDSWDHP